MAKKLDTKKVITVKLVIILIVGIILGISCIFSNQLEALFKLGDKNSGFVSGEVIDNSDLVVHYVDVGQGDCTLIQLPDNTVMMIDAGTSASATHIINYVKNLGITTLDYFILTHSDSDHAGGAKKIFESFEIKTVYRPFQIAIDDKSKNPIASEDLGVYYTTIYPTTTNTITTATYKNFINATYSETYIENGTTKSAEVYVTYDGLMISSTDISVSFTIEFFAPLKRTEGVESVTNVATKTKGYPTKYYGNGTGESKNNSSPVILLEYGETSFLFTGDATTEVEKDVMNSLSTAEKSRFSAVDVFQAGHHGSSGSNSQEFLNLITPDYVVASVGKDNKYHHPTDEFISRVDSLPHSKSDYLLRTDKIGDIAFGANLTGEPAYCAKDAGDGGVVVYWWQIALGAFIVISLVVILTKVTSNKKATTKRAVSTTKKVVKNITK